MEAVFEQEILVHDDMVSLIDRAVKQTIPLDVFFDTISKNKPMLTPVLPYNCRLMATNPKDKKSLFIMERTPKATPVSFCDRNDKIKNFVISLPFIQFYVMFSTAGENPGFLGCWLSCTKKPIMSDNDPIYVLPLPNQFDNGDSGVCTGHIRVATASIPVMCNELIAGYFGSPFNNDLNMEYPSIFGTNNHEKAFAKWDELTKKNPLLAISKDITYRESRFGTLKGKCEHLLKSGE